MSDESTDDLPRFDEPRTFKPKRQSPHLREVDLMGYEELHPVWPVTAEGLRAYVNQLAAQGGCVSFQYLLKQRVYANLVARLRELPPEERPRLLARRYRKMYGIDPDLTDDGIYDLLRELLKTARQAVADFNDRYIPEHLQAPFTSEGKLEMKTDPVEMLLEIASTPTLGLDPNNERDFIHRILLFEMRRDLVLGERLFAIWLKLQDITAGRPFEQFITELLEAQFFTPGVQRRAMLRVLIDPQTGNPLRILGADETPEGGDVIPMPLPCRYFKDPYGRELPVFFDPGQKKLDATLFKMIERRHTDPMQLNDLFRFQLVFRDENELALGTQALVERLPEMVGAITMRDTRRDHARREHNRITAGDEYRAIYLNCTYGGFRFEGQCHDVENQIRSRTSKGPVNHGLYKQRRADLVLPVLNPPEVFGVNWADPEIRRQVTGGE